jgi:(p)ppGpp synthase/HD superfamily hydrolase
MLFSSRIDLAIRVASVAHALDVRKGTELPYIAHPVHVALLLERDGWPEQVVIAGYLHDVVEDLEPSDARVQARFRAEFPALIPAPSDPQGFHDAVGDFIEDQFGREVKRLVDAVTEKKADAGGRTRPWIDRKREVVAHLRTADAHLAALKAADVTHNVRSILLDLESWGPRVLERFNASRQETLWYYDSVSREITGRLSGHTTRLPALLAASVQELAQRCAP